MTMITIQSILQFKAGDLIVKVGWMLHSWFLQLYRIIFLIIQNPMLDHFIMLVVLFDMGALITQTFQGVTVRTGWCFSAVDTCLLVFYVMEAVFKILVRGRTYFRNPWNDLDFFIMLFYYEFGGQASTPFQVLKTFKGGRAFRAFLRLLKAICLFIAGLMDNFQLSIHKKRPFKCQKSPVNEGEIQSTKKVVEVLEMSQSNIEEEVHKEVLRHASSEQPQQEEDRIDNQASAITGCCGPAHAELQITSLFAGQSCGNLL
ncbi:hypothetical protein MHYP_G00288970 [Metynnis hypsauchen]